MQTRIIEMKKLYKIQRDYSNEESSERLYRWRGTIKLERDQKCRETRTIEMKRLEIQRDYSNGERLE